MGRGPEETLRGYLACGDSHALHELGEWVHDDVVVHPPGGGPTLVGLPRLVGMWAAGHAALGGMRHTIEQVVVSGDEIALRWTTTGTHDGPILGIAPTGTRVDIPAATFARVTDGRIAEIAEVSDTGHALRQVGALGPWRTSPGALP